MAHKKFASRSPLTVTFVVVYKRFPSGSISSSCNRLYFYPTCATCAIHRESSPSSATERRDDSSVGVPKSSPSSVGTTLPEKRDLCYLVLDNTLQKSSYFTASSLHLPIQYPPCIKEDVSSRGPNSSSNWHHHNAHSQFNGFLTAGFESTTQNGSVSQSSFFDSWS